MSHQQLTLNLPVKHVKTNVFCTINEDFIWCYCFYQEPDNSATNLFQTLNVSTTCHFFKSFKVSTTDLKLLEEGEIIQDVVREVLLLDERAKIAIDPNDIENINFHVFRYNQSLDDPSVIFYKPWDVQEEWPYIFFLKLEDGKVLVNQDMEEPVQKIDLMIIKSIIPVLEVTNKSFLYAFV